MPNKEKKDELDYDPDNLDYEWIENLPFSLVYCYFDIKDMVHTIPVFQRIDYSVWELAQRNLSNCTQVNIELIVKILN